jgi:hypothetical protein
VSCYLGGVSVAKSESDRDLTLNAAPHEDRPWIAGEYWPRCHICGYDRRAQDEDDACPECGADVPTGAVIVWGSGHVPAVFNLWSRTWIGTITLVALAMIAVPVLLPLYVYVLVFAVAVGSPIWLRLRARGTGRISPAWLQFNFDQEEYGIGSGYGRVGTKLWPDHLGFRANAKTLRLYVPNLPGRLRWRLCEQIESFRPSGIRPLGMVRLIEERRRKELHRV